MQDSSKDHKSHQIFSGNIYIFHAFDVGDDINLEKIETAPQIKKVPLSLAKYFKNYHIPMGIELPDPEKSPTCVSSKIHNFGAVSLTYKIPFHDTLENLRRDINALDFQYYEKSTRDIKAIFNQIKDYIAKAHFYQTRASYIVIQINPQTEISISAIKDQFGGLIASTLRFETENLAEYQKNEILESAIGYFRGDLIIVDNYATFMYDDEYAELLDFFEFANIQQLELRYFDRVLDVQLNSIYEGKLGRIPVSSYFPFIGVLAPDPLAFLGKLKADISVITERLEGSIKLAGEPYYAELYQVLSTKLDIPNWNASINRKLEIIKDVQSVYQHKTEAIREHILSILVVILIFIEIVLGLFSYFK